MAVASHLKCLSVKCPRKGKLIATFGKKIEITDDIIRIV